MEKKDYYVIYPINGSAGTRNPTHGYLPFSSKDIEFMKDVLKTRKKENPEKFKRAFIGTREELKKLLEI